MLRYLLLILILQSIVYSAEPPVRTKITVRTAAELRKIFSTPITSTEIQLMPGEYHLTSIPMIDSTCGNCENPHENVPITVGLLISGSDVRLLGPKEEEAILYTNAGYGLYVKDCKDCSIEHITITGGKRDTNGNATDAAIVVKNSTAVIHSNRIIENLGDSAIVSKLVVGIMGIAGRENSRITISNNEIIRNSWDGIALYRDAEAVIENNLIDGVDKATGASVGGGRGVGIGITWNAKALVKGNLVRRYWKGIGIFVDGQATVNENIIEDILTWGLSLWDAGKGKPIGILESNIIYQTGACGASITSSTENVYPGRFHKNVLVQTAQNPRYDSPDYYCYQTALALHSVPKDFSVAQNIFYDNRRASDTLFNYDLPPENFYQQISFYCDKMALNNLLKTSNFYNKVCSTR